MNYDYVEINLIKQNFTKDSMYGGHLVGSHLTKYIKVVINYPGTVAASSEK